MEVEKEMNFTREQIMEILPDNDVSLDNLQQSISDEDFEKKVKEIKLEIEN